jgi:hypothetical protein
VQQAFEILGVVSLLGAIDVLYFHLYRFRLYRQPGSVAEELTHLVRGAIFVAVLAVMLFSDGSPGAMMWLVALAGLDLANSAVDVLLERGSREPLGGLPSLEYLLHVMSSFGLGTAVATMWIFGRDGFVPLAHDRFTLWRGVGMMALAGGLVVLEAALFARAIAERRLQPSAAA